MNIILFLLIYSVLSTTITTGFTQNYSQKITLVIHGGAGTIKRENMSDEEENAYRQKLTEALQAGYAILQKGGTSADAITAAVIIMENSPLFNAGKGAVFTHEGFNELDASFMDGKTLQAGAVAGVKTVKNPVLAARAVLMHSPHVLLTGKGAETFAQKQGLVIVAPAYFQTERRKKQLEKVKKKENTQGSIDKKYADYKFGTVGAVALDRYGNLAATTSTGGMTNKRFGRIGDSPIIGAGVYADNNSCAISCTGHGEYFMRGLIAYDVAARMKYKKIKLKKAAQESIYKKLTSMGGGGGLIAIDAKGNVAMPFNTAGMYRGFIKADGKAKVFIYKR